MQRIKVLKPEEAQAASRTILETLERKLGMAPNLHKTLAHSSAALRAYIGQNEALASGVLSRGLREQIALVTAGANQCDYCASAHTLIGRSAGVEDGELSQNLRGRSHDSRTQAALDFASAILKSHGRVTDAQLGAVRAAGFGDAEIVEIVAHVGMNIFTNYFNHVAETEIDFPVVRTAATAVA